MSDNPMSTWILLRGLTRESRHWGNFIDVFKEQVAATRIVSLDFPGNGRLHHLSSPCSIGAMVEFLSLRVARAKHFAAVSSVSVVAGRNGRSRMGCAHPQEVKAAVLINTSNASI